MEERNGRTLELTPVTLKEANGFVQKYHRHHKPSAGHKFSIGVKKDGKLAGYRKVITYILQSEPGTSLKASGFYCEGIAGGLSWNGERRPKQENQYPHEMKTRWVRMIKEGQRYGIQTG